jgi:hypothetical protein
MTKFGVKFEGLVFEAASKVSAVIWKKGYNMEAYSL